MDDTFTSLPKLFVDEMIKKCMNSHINVMAHLSKAVKWNKENQQMDQCILLINILSYVNFSKLCHVIQYFLELNKKIGQEDINLPLSSSSRAIGCRNKHLIEL